MMIEKTKEEVERRYNIANGYKHDAKVGAPGRLLPDWSVAGDQMTAVMWEVGADGRANNLAAGMFDLCGSVPALAFGVCRINCECRHWGQGGGGL